ncbi:MAG: hypothetical protein Q9211_003011 [Gyalolechia sp. 1 TL-2023]
MKHVLTGNASIQKTIYVITHDLLPVMNVHPSDDDMIDQVLSQENEELQALVTLLEDRSDEERPGARYGSDEESYDSIFLEISKVDFTNNAISRSNAQPSGKEFKASVDNEAMDTTG